ncbi:MAG: hypothetical protein J5616_07300 [Bacteroidaceae bacterium]|nr:hypothetical protein [Bacteroidaceae bacterium]
MYVRKSLLLLSVVTVSLFSCQEKKPDFFEREAREYTEKHCPEQMDAFTRLDSLVFEKGSKGEIGTLNSYYTLTLTDAARAELMNRLGELGDLNMKTIRNSVILAKHKEAGVTFHYVYYDEATGEKIAEYRFTKKDYE